MKYRKQDSKSNQSNAVSLGEPSRIFFLTSGTEGRIAQLLFDAEARKMEVYWTASAFCHSSDTAQANFNNDSADASATIASLKNMGLDNIADLDVAPPMVTDEELQKAKLVVLVQKPDSDDHARYFATAFPTYKGEKEIWEVATEANAVETLLQNVKSLLVRLILKGGKRAPVPLPPSPVVGKPSVPQKSVRVRLESKGRAGKKVTVVFGLDMEGSELDSLAAALKQTCGTGGTVKDGTIEIQGDQCDRVLAELKRRGMQAKRSGG